jgi:hypothetical protein
MCIRFDLVALTDCTNLSVTDDLDKATLKARLRWWLTMADKIDEGTPVSRRTALVAQSALGQFQVRLISSLSLRRLHAYCHPVRPFARGVPSVTTHIYCKSGIELHLQTYNNTIPYHLILRALAGH